MTDMEGTAAEDGESITFTTGHFSVYLITDDGQLYPDTEWYDESKDEFEISTADELAGLAQLVNEGNSFEDIQFTLAANIDLLGAEWTPIGTTSNKFLGDFDGNGYTISNLKISGTNNYAGLFGSVGRNKYAVRAELTDITIVNADVSGGKYVGGIVGEAFCVNISDCHVTGDVSVVGSDRYVGGIVGHLYGTVTESSVVDTTDAPGAVTARYMVGGILGFLGEGNSVGENVIDGNSIENITVSATSGGWCGGIAGSILTGATISDNKLTDCTINAGTDNYGNGGGLSGLIVGQNGGGDEGGAPSYIINNAPDEDTTGTVNNAPMTNIADPAAATSTVVGTDVKLDEDNKVIAGNFESLDTSLVNEDKADIEQNPDGSFGVIYREVLVDAKDYKAKYNGKSHVISVDVLTEGATIFYSDDSVNYLPGEPEFTNAGEYTVYYMATKDGYKEAMGSINVTIEKLTLRAYYPGETITEGETPELNVIVKGFIKGENEENALDYNAPTVDDSKTEPGVYYLSPEGGEARNYEFEYFPGVLLIRPEKGELPQPPVEDDDDDDDDDDYTRPVKPVKPQSPFRDVDVDDECYDDVIYVYEKGLMNGVTENKFAPDAALERAMLVVILYRLEGQPDVQFSGKFHDVADGTWYTEAVEWASANGIVNGFPGDVFQPNTPLTREQMVCILFRYAQYKGLDAVNTSELLSGYVDGDDASAYAVSALNWALGYEMLEELDGGMLCARSNATRAQVAATLVAFCENVLKYLG